MTPNLRGVASGAAAELTARLRTAVGPHRMVPGWATVDLDRAQATLADQLDPSRMPSPASDAVLGAAGRHLVLADGQEVVLLEPFTEGRLAAALAQHGEGRLVSYVLARASAPSRARAAGLALGAPGQGPFGPEQLVLGGPRRGPFVLLAEEA